MRKLHRFYFELSIQTWIGIIAFGIAVLMSVGHAHARGFHIRESHHHLRGVRISLHERHALTRTRRY